MKIKELIEELKKYDDKMEVRVFVSKREYDSYEDILPGLELIKVREYEFITLLLDNSLNAGIEV